MAVIESDIPARLDRLPWSRWHWLVVVALGITWILDGLEVTIVGSLGSVLQEPETLGLSARDVGWSATAYIAGAIVGALFFGRLTDRLGRKKLFLVTLGVYLGATALTATSWSFASFACFRALTGFGIGGECAAMNSAIDELLPARVRGFADIALNGTYWIGAAMGALASVVLLDPRVLGHRLGWRVAFGLGAVLGFSILFVRRMLPESPRWLLIHGRADEAEAVVQQIEATVMRYDKLSSLPPPLGRVEIQVRPRHLDRRRRAPARRALPAAHGARPWPHDLAGVLLQRDLLHLRARARHASTACVPSTSASTSCRSPSATSSAR